MNLGAFASSPAAEVDVDGRVIKPEKSRAYFRDRRATMTPEQRAADRVKRTATQKAKREQERAEKATRLASAPAVVPVLIPGRSLVRDRRLGDDLQRRRGDCANLGPCEVAWSTAMGTTQARCPASCDGFEKEERR